MKNTRRKFLYDAGAITMGAGAMTIFNLGFMNQIKAASARIMHLNPMEAAMDEDFWFSVQQAFTPSPNILNLNNGGVSPQPRATQEAHQHYLRQANELPSYYLFNIQTKEREVVRTKLADLAGVTADEIAMNRNSSEGLETIIFGITLKAGDEVIISNQDYPNMLNAWHQRVKRDGIVLKTISIPVPCLDNQEIIGRYQKEITSKTKVIHLSHMVNLTGQILPVREICDMAHDHGLEVIVDAAHTFAQLDYKISDLHCDYYATSLHKWLCAPFGTGMMYISKEKIKNIWPLFGAPKEQSDSDIRKFENLGTRSFPAELSIAESIHFHLGIGARRKEERLRYLKNYWAEKVCTFPGVKMNTSLKPEHSCALANFSVQGKDPGELHSKLWEQYKIYTTSIVHDEFHGLRITPHIYTTLKDLDYFVNAVGKICKA